MNLLIGLSLLALAEPAKLPARGTPLIPVVTPNPSAEVLAAWRDASRLPADQAKQTRYLSLYNVPVERRAEFVKVLNFHVNSLSREADLVRPRRITDSLLAIELDAYGWSAAAWDRLADADPWFHAQVQATVTGEKDQEFGYYVEGRWVTTRVAKVPTKEAKQQTVSAPWLPLMETYLLVAATGSPAPIYRADWFIDQTGQQRGDRGYYDFLGFAKLADAEALAGLDRKGAAKSKKEVAAIVTDSGVTLNNRQIFRFGTVSGGWWETRDANTSTAKRNAVRNLDGDFEFDAMEIYFTLPNGLFGLVLADKQGVLQNSAPDTIAADHVSTSNDRRVRAGISCIRCHQEGLRPVQDWARVVFRAGNETALGSPDREKAKRLRQLYLGQFQRVLADDRQRYTETLNDFLGMKPDEISRQYAAAWRAYESDPILPADAARELGSTEDELLSALRDAAKRDGLSDLAFAGWLADPPQSMRREHLEEMAPVLFTLIQKGKP